MQALRAPTLLASLLYSGCAGVYVDLAATGYPAMRATSRGEPPPVGRRPLANEQVSTAVGVTIGAELDDGRSSRWAVGYGLEAVALRANGSARHHFNDLRLDVTLKTLDDDTRLRLGIGGGIGAGFTRLFFDDGSVTSYGAASARLYSGPIFARYVGNHLVLSLMLGGAYQVLGAGDYEVRGWGLTSHVTFAYTIADTHGDVTLYSSLSGGARVSDYAIGAMRIGCRVDTAAPDQAHAVCDEGEIELHLVGQRLHVHCSRSTATRCEALRSRIRAASDCKEADVPCP